MDFEKDTTKPPQHFLPHLPHKNSFSEELTSSNRRWKVNHETTERAVVWPTALYILISSNIALKKSEKGISIYLFIYLRISLELCPFTQSRDFCPNQVTVKTPHL